MANDDRERELPELAGDYSIGSFVSGPNVIIRRVIGRGGQATVYEAEKAMREPDGTLHPLGILVALKVIHPHLAGDARAIVMEACTLARLRHPHIAKIDTAGFTNDDRKLAYIVMELLDGIGGRQLLKRMGRLPIPNVLDIALGLASGLAEAHKKGIIHQDIKPENIFVHTDPTGKCFPKLFDWGIRQLDADSVVTDPTAPMVTSPSGPPAEASAAGSTVSAKGDEKPDVKLRYQGTPSYSPPEQLRGIPATPRTDVYAFGTTMFELFTSYRPFHTAEQADLKAKAGRLGADGNWQKSNHHLIHAKLNEEAPKLSTSILVPRQLEDLVARCLSRDPAQRPADASELLGELTKILEKLHPSFSEEGGPTTQDILLDAVRTGRADSSASLRAASKEPDPDTSAPGAVAAPLPAAVPRERRPAFADAQPSLVVAQVPVAASAPVVAALEHPAVRERRPAFAQQAPEPPAPDLGRVAAAAGSRLSEPLAPFGSSGPGGETDVPAAERPKTTLEGGVTPLPRPGPPTSRSRTIALVALAVAGAAIPASGYVLLKAHASSASAAATSAASPPPSAKEAPSTAVSVGAVPSASAEVPPIPAPAPRPAESVAVEPPTPEAPDTGASPATESASADLAAPSPTHVSRSLSPAPRGTSAPTKSHASAPPAASSKNDALLKLLHK